MSRVPVTMRRDARYRRAFGLAPVLLILVGSPLQGQEEPIGDSSPRVYRGLFGGVSGRSDRPQSLDFNASLFGGYDDDIFARGSAPRGRDRRLGGGMAGLQASLGYRKQYPTYAFTASASTAGRWVTATGDVVPTYHGANVGYSQNLSPRTIFGLSQRMAYRPFFNFVPLPGASTIGPSLDELEGDDIIEPIVADDVSNVTDDFTIAPSREAITYAGGLHLGHTLSERSGLSFGAGYSVTSFGTAEYRDLSSARYRAALRYSRRLTQYASLRLGYGYRTSRLRNGIRNDNHDIDVGVSYGRPFTFGRGRTTFSVTTGSTMLVRDRLDIEGPTGSRLVFRAIGTARLRHDFVGPWQGQVAYVRSVRFIDGFSDPLFTSDRVIASLGGLLNRRTDVQFQAGYVLGGFGSARRAYNTTLASARIRTGLTRHMGLFAQYFYYQYDFQESISSALVVPPALERQGVRAGLTVWLPLLR